MFLIYRFSIMFTFAVSTFVFQYPPRYCFVVSQTNAFDFTAIQSCLRSPFLFSFFNIRFRCCCCCLAFPLATSRLLPRKRKSQIPFRESQFVITWCFTRIRLDPGRILINFRLLSFNNNKKSRSLTATIPTAFLSEQCLTGLPEAADWFFWEGIGHTVIQ